MNLALSIILPAFNEEKYILSILESLSALAECFEQVEILVIDGRSSDATCELVTSFSKSSLPGNLIVRLIDNTNRFQAFALNLGLQHATHPVCIRFDCHSCFASSKNLCQSIMSVAAMFCDSTASDSFSGIGFKQRFAFTPNVVQAGLFCLSHSPILSGFRAYRYAVNSMYTSKTVWLFAIKRELALKVGGFASDGLANEDFSFNQDLIKMTGKPLFLFADLHIYYYPRSSYLDVFRQYFNYGFSRSSRDLASGQFRLIPRLFVVARAFVFVLGPVLFSLAALCTHGLFLVFYYTVIAALVAIFYRIDRGHFLRHYHLMRSRSWGFLFYGWIFSPICFLIVWLASFSGSVVALIKTRSRLDD